MNKSHLSGAPYSCASLMRKYCGDVDLVDQIRPDKVTVTYLLKNGQRLFCWLYLMARLREKIWKLFGKNFEWDRMVFLAKYYARKLGQRLCGKPYDFIFSSRGSVHLAYLKTDVPVIYETDATFRSMVDYYPNFFNLAPQALREGDRLERMALEKAVHIIATSHWAADSMVSDYGIDKARITILPPAALFDEVPSVEKVLCPKKRDLCELFFIGREWKRKGGVFALEAVRWLNENNTRARLTIVGCIPEIPEDMPKEYLNIIGFLDQNKAAGRSAFEQLYREAHFLIVPTRAETCARVFSESSAYGVPIITTDTGGTSTAVRNDENGFLMNYNSSGVEYGRVIQELWTNVSRYNSLRVSTRAAFDRRLSDKVWGETVCRVMKEIASGSRS